MAPWDTMNSNDLLYATITEQSYSSKPLPVVQGYRLVKKEKECIIYSKGRNFIVGFRGTAASRDLLSDGLLASGMEGASFRFRRSYKIVKRLLKKRANVSICGHSLGGAIVLYICSILSQVQGYAFNPGAGLNIRRCIKKCANLTIYTTNSDFISKLDRKSVV